MLSLSTSLSGLRASIARLDAAANNIANLNTPGYRAQRVRFSEAAEGGVQGEGLRESDAAAVPEGSNVDLAAEQVALLTSGLSARANLNAIRAQDALARELVDLGNGAG